MAVQGNEYPRGAIEAAPRLEARGCLGLVGDGEPVKLGPASPRITADWQSEFPELVRFASRQFGRRVGPFIVGLLLERDSSNDNYEPMFHMHSLLTEHPAVSLHCRRALFRHQPGVPSRVTVASHDARWRDAATRMREQAPEITGSLTADHVAGLYERAFPLLGKHSVAAIVGAFAWCGQYDLAGQKAKEFLADARRGPCAPIGDPTHRVWWRSAADLAELEEAVRLAQAPRPELERRVLARAVALKVDRLPYTELLP